MGCVVEYDLALGTQRYQDAIRQPLSKLLKPRYREFNWDSNSRDNIDAVYSSGDIITVTFSKATNQPPISTKANLDTLFTFSQNLGTDYTGSWSSTTVLVIDIVDSTGSTPPSLGSLALTAKVGGNLLDSAGDCTASTRSSGAITGGFCIVPFWRAAPSHPPRTTNPIHR